MFLAGYVLGIVTFAFYLFAEALYESAMLKRRRLQEVLVRDLEEHP